MKRDESLLSTAAIAVIAGSTLLTLAGCASGPDPRLAKAQAAVQAARDDQLILAYAPARLADAEQPLQQAEAAAAEGADEQEVDHLAYLAEQEAAIARFHALEEQSQQQVAVADEQVERVLERLRAQRTERGVVITLEDVLFEVNQATLRPTAYNQLLRLAEFLRWNQGGTVLVEGNTDNSGNSEQNLELSELRAQAVRDFLVANGVAPLRVQAVGYGETRPVASNDSAAGRQENRRVEIVLQDVEAIARAPGG
jgi:outer membrane protein OmpA-like peptidoglycan-associated protein